MHGQHRQRSSPCPLAALVNCGPHHLCDDTLSSKIHGMMHKKDQRQGFLPIGWKYCSSSRSYPGTDEC
jgi:hypothetical protein